VQERFDVLVILENDSWYRGSIGKRTLETIYKAQQRGSNWEGEVYLQGHRFKEGEKLRMKNILIEQKYGVYSED